MLTQIAAMGLLVFHLRACLSLSDTDGPQLKSGEISIYYNWHEPLRKLSSPGQPQSVEAKYPPFNKSSQVGSDFIDGPTLDSPAHAGVVHIYK